MADILTSAGRQNTCHDLLHEDDRATAPRARRAGAMQHGQGTLATAAATPAILAYQYMPTGSRASSLASTFLNDILQPSRNLMYASFHY